MCREADDLNDLKVPKVPKVLKDFKVLREYSAVCFLRGFFRRRSFPNLRLRRPFRPLFVFRSAAPLSAPRKEIF